MVVKGVLTALGFEVVDVGLGYAEIASPDLDKTDMERIDNTLRIMGFELITDSKQRVTEEIKVLLMGYARNDGGLTKKVSVALEEDAKGSYKTLSRIFTQTEGRSIENYYISQRIEYVKELLDYGELSLAEIAYKTGYSSVAYLSRQFAQTTGMTISAYRERERSGRKPLCEI
jgi:AraC-like DNA-binding protein